MNIEFHKNIAINNTSKDVYVVSLDNRDLILVQEIQHVDDSTEWKIDEWYFYTKEVFTIEEIVESFVKRYEDSDSRIEWYNP